MQASPLEKRGITPVNPSACNMQGQKTINNSDESTINDASCLAWSFRFLGPHVQPFTALEVEHSSPPSELPSFVEQLKSLLEALDDF